jgi:hypothetical protein
MTQIKQRPIPKDAAGQPRVGVFGFAGPPLTGDAD